MGGSVRPLVPHPPPPPNIDEHWLVAGYPTKGPYEAIHVGAAARTIPPALVEQLASPGRMIIPVGTYSQTLMQVDKDARGDVTQKDLFGVVVRCAAHFLAVAIRIDSALYSTYRSQTGLKVPCKINHVLYHISLIENGETVTFKANNQSFLS